MIGRTFQRALPVILALLFLCPGNSALQAADKKRHTTVMIRGDQFFINGQPTYAERVWRGSRIEGLLLNSRMVQGIFDDLNPETASRWNYPDTGRWDPDRNTREFIEAMPQWRRHGLLCVVLNLQGGSPEGYSPTQPWHNSAIRPDGSLRADYMRRLEQIIDRADELGMVVMTGLFYFGQDQRLQDESAVKRAVTNMVGWVADRGYRNVLIEIANECDNRQYEQEIIKAERVHELIRLAQEESRRKGHPLPVSTRLNTTPTCAMRSTRSQRRAPTFCAAIDDTAAPIARAGIWM